MKHATYLTVISLCMVVVFAGCQPSGNPSQTTKSRKNDATSKQASGKTADLGVNEKSSFNPKAEGPPTQQGTPAGMVRSPLVARSNMRANRAEVELSEFKQPSPDSPAGLASRQTVQDQTGVKRSVQIPENALKILAWNVESEGNDPDVIAEQLQEFEGYHIFALSEVLKYNVRRFADAIAHGEPTSYRFVYSQTGRTDRLAIVYDENRLELLQYSELFLFENTKLNDWRHRSPLVANLRDRKTSTEFLLMVNHLARGDEELRTEQARGLRLWAARQSLPVICVGDFNFDFQFETQRGNAAFDEFTLDDTWKWIRPAEWIDTNWADWDEDGKDDYPGSMLDFAFVAGPAKTWVASSSVIVRRRDFPDTYYTSDHRPVELIIVPKN